MRKSIFIAAAFIGCHVLPATATGNLGCEVADENMELSVESGITSGLGEPVFNFRGELAVKQQSVSEDLRKVTFDTTNLAQYWMQGNDLRLRVYRDIEGKTAQGSVELIIRTQSIDDVGGFEGSYDLIIFDSAGRASGDPKESKFSGKASCSAG